MPLLEGPSACGYLWWIDTALLSSHTILSPIVFDTALIFYFSFLIFLKSIYRIRNSSVCHRIGGRSGQNGEFRPLNPHVFLSLFFDSNSGVSSHLKFLFLLLLSVVSLQMRLSVLTSLTVNWPDKTACADEGLHCPRGGCLSPATSLTEKEMTWLLRFLEETEKGRQCFEKVNSNPVLQTIVFPVRKDRTLGRETWDASVAQSQDQSRG